MKLAFLLIIGLAIVYHLPIQSGAECRESCRIKVAPAKQKTEEEKNNPFQIALQQLTDTQEIIETAQQFLIDEKTRNSYLRKLGSSIAVTRILLNDPDVAGSQKILAALLNRISFDTIQKNAKEIVLINIIKRYFESRASN